MLITIVGDIHTSLNNLDKVEKLFNDIEEIGLEVIHLGDIFNDKAIIRAECLNLVYEKLKKSKLKHTILIGNHDLINLQSKEHSLETLKELSNVNIIDSLQICGGMSFIPYIHDLAEFRTELDKVPRGHILFIHQGVNDFDYGNGIIEEKGIDFSEFKEFPLVIAGHFHKYAKKDNLVYLGTPFSQNFGETNQDKKVAILNTENLFLKYIPTDFPRHMTLELDLAAIKDSTSLDARLFEAGIDKARDLIRVVLSGTEEALLKFDRSSYPNIKFIEKCKELASDEVKISETSSNSDQFLMWCKTNALKKEIIELGLEILKANS